jgi:signal transduction histidine kinase
VADDVEPGALGQGCKTLTQPDVVVGQGDAHRDDCRSGSPYRGASALLRPVATRGLQARMVVAGGLLALIVGGAFAVLLVAVAGEREALDLSRHSERVLVSARALERLVIDLETGERGFLLTGDESFLEPWTAAQAALPDATSELEELARVPRQHDRAQAITGGIASYLENYSLPVVAAARRGDPAARSAATTEEGKRRVDALRAEFDVLRATERELASDRQDRANAATDRALAAAVAGLVGSVLLILLVVGYLARAIVMPVRRASAMAGRLAGGDLSVRMPETGVGEISALERSFNTMAHSLETNRAELTASRARVVAAGDDARRRIERDLHDGTQQRLVSLGLELRAAEAMVPPGSDELRALLSSAAEGLAEAVEDLQEISRGIHPAILSKGGLGPALKALARRSAVPVELDLRIDRRLPEPVEVAAYYVVSEALTNAAKHANPSLILAEAEASDRAFRLAVRDDGAGGADPDHGSGLLGLRDRVEAIGGRLEVTSPPGGGTSLRVTIPVGD